MDPRRRTMVEMLAALLVLGTRSSVFSQHASAVHMYKGDNVLLFCEFPTFEMNNPTATWSRSDLSPSMVHRRQQAGDELKGQNQLYRGRTAMVADALEAGDLSLNLTGLTLSDSGTYTCSVSSARGQRKVQDVQLQVKERFPSWATALLVVLAAVLLLAGGLVILFRQYLISDYKVKVDSGTASVLLPCRTLVRLPPDATVAWTSGSNTVHECRGGADRVEAQYALYRGRAERKLQTDLSLTLNFPADEDSGTYTCTAYNRRGQILLVKHVKLQVKVSEVEVDEGQASVLLAFRTTPLLPEDTVVQWTKYEPERMRVHTHYTQPDNRRLEEPNQIYRNRTQMDGDALTTGNLSLTLHRPNPGDTGRYVCGVWGGTQAAPVLLRNKTVRLKVKGRRNDQVCSVSEEARAAH